MPGPSAQVIILREAERPERVHRAACYTCPHREVLRGVVDRASACQRVVRLRESETISRGVQTISRGVPCPPVFGALLGFAAT